MVHFKNKIDDGQKSISELLKEYGKGEGVVVERRGPIYALAKLENIEKVIPEEETREETEQLRNMMRAVYGL